MAGLKATAVLCMKQSRNLSDACSPLGSGLALPSYQFETCTKKCNSSLGGAGVGGLGSSNRFLRPECWSITCNHSSRRAALKCMS